MNDLTTLETINVGRRGFLKAGAVVGGGLLIGFQLPLANRTGEAKAAATEFAPNAWIRIDADDTITLRVASSEMGQGVYTAIPMLLAEELECDAAKEGVQFITKDGITIQYRSPAKRILHNNFVSPSSVCAPTIR